MNSNDPYENLDFIPPMYDDVCTGYNPKVYKNAMRFGLVALIYLIISLVLTMIFKPIKPQENIVTKEIQCSTIK